VPPGRGMLALGASCVSEAVSSVAGTRMRHMRLCSATLELEEWGGGSRGPASLGLRSLLLEAI